MTVNIERLEHTNESQSINNCGHNNEWLNLMFTPVAVGLAQQIETELMRLSQVGIDQKEIIFLTKIVQSRVGYTSIMGKIPMSVGTAMQIDRLFKIRNGIVILNSFDDYVNHFKTMSGYLNRDGYTIPKIGMGSLPKCEVKPKARNVIVHGIKDERYSVLNNCMYEALKHGSSVVIKTKKKIVLPYGYSKTVDGVLEVIEAAPEYKRIVIKQSNFVECNRYVVVASFREPREHIGMQKIITAGGTVVYVYARQEKGSVSSTYYKANQREYKWGFNKDLIATDLADVANFIYHSVYGVYREIEEPNREFSLVGGEEIIEEQSAV